MNHVRSYVLLVVGSGIAGGAPSCSSSPDHSITLADYSTSCTVDSDCIAISVGGLCPCADCPNAAINKRDAQRYQNDVQSRSQCSTGSGCAFDSTSVVECAPCPKTPSAVCLAGRCAIPAPAVDAGKDARAD